MKDRDVSVGALGRAIDTLGPQFRTKDVSNHPEVTRALHRFVSDFNYHAAVGKALSGNRRSLGIELRSTTGGNATWGKVAAASVPASAPVPASVPASAPVPAGERPDPHDLGPQSGGDTPFAARMRLHQSWYRATVLQVPCGTGPQAASQSHYGNMLDAAAGAAGLNFLTPEIVAIARARIAQGGGVEPFRCLHNMLSSQPMCFNLLGPLVADLDLATRCMRALLPDEVDRVTEVRIEYAPAPADEYLGDRTSFDAFVGYTPTRRHECVPGHRDEADRVVLAG